MAQIFRKSSNSFARVSLVGAGIFFFGFWGVVYAVYRSPYTTNVNVPLAQPAPFSHQHHVAGLGLDCRYCHTTVEKSAFAGMPPTEICMTCHSQVWKDAPVLAPVRESLATGLPIEWNRVNQLPDFVFFNHSIHVQKGVGCSTCHGAVDQMPITWKAHSLYMRWCLDCHEAPQKFLRPRDQIFNVEWQAPPDQLERGRELIAAYHISTNRLQQLRDCSMCHR
jgi:ferredoxin